MSSRGLSDQAGLELPDDRPAVLSGEPKALRGRLRLRNGGAEKIVLREAWIRPPAERGDHTQVLPPVHAALSTTLQPGQEQHVALSLEIDHHTPPGEYAAQLDVGGRSQPVVLHVVETVRLNIAPQPIVLDQAAGATVTRRVVLTNDGNVPLTIGEIGRVRLGEELPLARSMRATIGAVGGQRQSLEEFFAEIVRDEARLVMRQIGTLDVRHHEAPVVIEPGAVRTIEIEIGIPDALEAGHRYIGRAPLYTSDLEFVVVPVSGGKKPPAGDADSSREPRDTTKT